MHRAIVAEKLERHTGHDHRRHSADDGRVRRHPEADEQLNADDCAENAKNHEQHKRCRIPDFWVLLQRRSFYF